jgi:phosphatidylserine/phosphatidylglycerophosphate/cardiolipin synthase-like enzyme
VAAGIPVKRTDGGGGGIMQNKVAVFDRQVLLTGSYNWSTAAEESNDENAVFIRTPSVVATYQSTFDNLWSTR